MKLKKWITQFPASERVQVRTDLATHLNISEVTVRSYANGSRSVPAERAPLIEEYTQGEVTCIDLCPKFPWPQFTPASNNESAA